MPRSWKRPGSACIFRAGRTISVKKRAAYRRARACPSPCSDREGNGFGRRAFFAQIGRSRRTGPRATVDEAASLYRRARDRPSPGLGRGKDLSRRAFFAQVGRSRGTGPRATGPEGVRLAMRRSGAGAPELQSSAPNPVKSWKSCKSCS